MWKVAGMRRARTILKIVFPLLFIGLFSFVSNPPPAHAQATPTLIYTTGFETEPDVDYAYGGTTPFAEDWDASCGVDASACVQQIGEYEWFTSDTRYSIIYFQEGTPTTSNPEPQAWEACAVNYVEFDLYYHIQNNGAGGTPSFQFFFAASDNNDAAFHTATNPDTYDVRADADVFALPGNTQDEYFHVAVPLDNDADMNSWALWWQLGFEGLEDPIDVDLEIRIDNLKVWCDFQQQWIRPLAQADESTQWEMFDDPYAESLDDATFDNPQTWVNAFSTSYHAPVHSAHAGTVALIRPLEVGHYPCGDDAISLILNECITFIPKEITNDSGGELYQLDIVNAYFVEVDFDDNFSLYYIVANAPNYIQLSQEIGEGCIIGETIQLKQVLDLGAITVGGSAGSGGIGGSVGGTFQSTLTGTGYVAERLSIDSAEVRLYPRLTRYSTDEAPCMSTDPRFINCLGNDPSLTQADGDGRSTSGNVTFDNPGYTLVSRNALIKEMDMLDADTEYGLSVDVQAEENGGEIELKLGQTTETHFITANPGETQTLSIASDIHLADLTDAWTVQVKNISSASIKVLSICVSAGDVAGLPTACYFVNPSFDNGYANWDVSEGVGQRDGSVTVPSGDTIAQDATLPADTSDTTFQLYVDVYIWTDPGVTIDRTDYTSTVGLEWRFPDSDADWTPLVGPSSQEDVTFSEFALEAERAGVTVGTISYQGFITIDADTTGTVEIRPTVTTETSGILGVGIDRACLRGDFGPPQVDPNGNCQDVTRPQDELLSSWTVWLWRHFDNFFQCDLMIVLRQIRNTTYSIYQLTGWSIRYWKASYFYGVQWLSSDLFPWLNGQFNNLAKGSQSVYYINNNSGSNLWDFLVALLNNTLGPLINGLSSVLNNLIVQLGGLLGGLLNFAGLVLSLIANLIMLLIQSIANILTLVISGLINIIMFVLFGLLSIVQLIISGLFSLIFTLLLLIFSLLRDVIGLFVAIITGWQTATPTPIPGFPTCNTDPTTSFMCVPLYILSNTLFEPNTPGELLMTLIIGYGSFELILWVISEVRGGILEAMQAA